MKMSSEIAENVFSHCNNSRIKVRKSLQKVLSYHFRSDYFTRKNYFTEKKKSAALYSSVHTMGFRDRVRAKLRY